MAYAAWAYQRRFPDQPRSRRLAASMAYAARWWQRGFVNGVVENGLIVPEPLRLESILMAIAHPEM